MNDIEKLENGESRAEEEERNSVESKEERKFKHKHRHRHKHKSSRTHSMFVDDAASEGESEESDENYVQKMSAKDLEEEERMRKEFEQHEKRQKRHLFDKDEETLSPEEIARRIEERYKKGEVFEYDEHKPKVISKMSLHARFSHNLLPRAGDPKVFSVKCRAGMARTLVVRIVKKCFDYRQGKNYERIKMDLGIISVFSVDHVKEYIYVESYRRSFVDKALEGLVGLFRFTLGIVDTSELMQLMERQSSASKPIEIGSFVRLRRIPYKGDLAQVIRVDKNGGRVIAKVVPRVDFVGKPYLRPAKREIPKAQRFFNPAMAVGAEMGANGCYNWGPLQFDTDGYLIVNFTHRMVIYGEAMIPPTTEELALFFKNDRDKVQSAASQVARPGDGTVFKLGDYVRARGQLNGTVGRISNIDNVEKSVNLVVETNKGTLSVKVSTHDISKYLREGSHVNVTDQKDPMSGETGTVIQSTSDGRVIVISDSTGKEFKVWPNSCSISSIVAPAGTTHHTSEYSLFDLVLLNDGVTICCIIGLREKNVTVIEKTNIVRTVHLRYIRQKIFGRLSSFDKLRNTIKVRDEVCLEAGVDALLIGTTAEVKQLHGDHVFVRSKAISQNSGIISVPIKAVRVLGARNKAHGMTVMKQLNPIIPKLHPDRDVTMIVPGLKDDASASWTSAPIFDEGDNF